jgi:hypothetical protein
MSIDVAYETRRGMPLGLTDQLCDLHDNFNSLIPTAACTATPKAPFMATDVTCERSRHLCDPHNHLISLLPTSACAAV